MSTLLEVKPRTLNLRAGPGTEHPILRELHEATAVLRVGATDDGAWVYVTKPLPGWLAARYLGPIDNEPPRWLAIAREEMGTAEISGSAANARIVEYHSKTTLRSTSDEVPWCSAFACWVMEKVGIESTRSAAARSWLRWGRPILNPELGCVVVLRRGSNPASGHVAFFLSKEGDRIRLLGGNQGNRVKESIYPVADVLGYRMPL